MQMASGGERHRFQFRDLLGLTAGQRALLLYPAESGRGDHRVQSHEFVISVLTRAHTLLGEGLLTPSSNEGD
jgi:hypothetical protein